jgi:hypothetical protein
LPTTLEDHVEHVKIVIDILAKEKLYLSKRKLKILCEELKILGHIIDGDGIHMDPAKIEHTTTSPRQKQTKTRIIFQTCFHH